MLIRFLLPLLISANWVAAQDYFQLRAAAGGCLGRRQYQDDLFLTQCDFNDPNTMWRWDVDNRLHSKAAENDCVQAAQAPQVLEGVEALDRGTTMYVKNCNAPMRMPFQSFSEDWEVAGLVGDMYLASRPDLCMTHFGADAVIGESRIMLVPCAELGSDRGMGWTAVFPEYNFFTLEGAGGGCIGMRGDGSDELLLKECSSQDESIQWRLDDQSRFRSKVNEQECMQAGRFPELLQGPQGLAKGTSMYVKGCAGPLKNRFQVMNTAIPMPLALDGPQGPLTLESRKDLCIVHFGAEPVIGESRIMLANCVELGGDRAKGWEAVPPCEHPPFCPGVCTLDIFTCDDGTTVSRDPDNNCEFEPCPQPGVCTADIFTCDDGTTVVRDPANNCEFEPCPDAGVCTLDVEQCPDGSFVSRDPANNCEFFPCPDPVGCTLDIFTCDDGTTVSRDPDSNCEFFPCPAACTLDVFTCPDGVTVSRDPDNNCEFFPCPVACSLDIRTCPDGSTVVRDPNNNCEFFPCPDAACTQDVEQCPDGSFVGRDPANNCEFFACPDPVGCTLDIFTCEDGTTVVRDPANNCEFFPCPAACTFDVFTCDDGTTVGRDPANNCEFFACPVACTLDIFTCNDGTTVGRDPANNCEFFACPAACTLDIFTCNDGTTVGRDPANNCEFFACPAACTLDIFTCNDGTTVGRDPANNCEFFACPGTGVCQSDIFVCPDGTEIIRVPPECLFPSCPPLVR